VFDVVKATVKAALCQELAGGEVLNIGSGKNNTTIALCQFKVLWELCYLDGQDKRPLDVLGRKLLTASENVMLVSTIIVTRS